MPTRYQCIDAEGEIIAAATFQRERGPTGSPHYRVVDEGFGTLFESNCTFSAEPINEGYGLPPGRVWNGVADSGVRSEQAAAYKTPARRKMRASKTRDRKTRTSKDAAIIAEALAILEAEMRGRPQSDPLTQPSATRTFLRLKLADREAEFFCCVFLDTRHRVLAIEEMFRGTIDGASVHPREVVKEALARNAAAVVFAHNHPSGNAEPSEADRRLTRRLSDALTLVDIRVLDHFVIGDGEPVSFAERGLL